MSFTSREAEILRHLDSSRGLEPIRLADIANSLGVGRKTVESHLYNARAKVSPRFKQQLTARQAQIVQLVGKGQTNKDIAGELAISENTVKHHLQQIFSRLGVNSRLQVALSRVAAE